MSTAVENFQVLLQHLGTSPLPSPLFFFTLFLCKCSTLLFYAVIKKLICSQLVLDSHRWVPLPAVGFSNSVGEESQEDVTPPSYLMEHPPLAVFINGKPS